MGQAQLRSLEDYTHFRRLMLSGDLPTTDGLSVPTDAAADTGDLGFVQSMGYHYNDAATLVSDQFVKTALANTHFIHGAFESTATSGTARGEYLILNLNGAGQAGECIRARTFVMATTGANSSTHGAHIELRLNGTTTGGAGAIASTADGAAVRATLSVDAGATITTGTIAALRLDSNFGVANTTSKSAFISLFDVGTYNMRYFLNLPINAGLGNADVATGAQMVIRDGSKAANTFTTALRVNIAGTDYYLPLGTTFS
jgi:hypothetical protein